MKNKTSNSRKSQYKIVALSITALFVQSAFGWESEMEFGFPARLIAEQTTDQSGEWILPFVVPNAPPPSNIHYEDESLSGTTKIYTRGVIAPSRVISESENQAIRVESAYIPRVAVFDRNASAPPLHSIQVGVLLYSKTTVDFFSTVHSLVPPPGGYGIAVARSTLNPGTAPISTEQSSIDGNDLSNSLETTSFVFDPRNFYPSTLGGYVAWADLGQHNMYTSSQAWHDHPSPFAITLAAAEQEFQLFEPFVNDPVQRELEREVPGIQWLNFKFFAGTSQVGDSVHALPVYENGEYTVGVPYPTADGSYTVRMTKQSMLDRVYSFSISNSVLTANYNYVETMGDVDSSNEIDGADLDLAIEFFGSSAGSFAWNMYRPDGIAAFISDLDGNDEVDSADLDLIIANFGMVGD